MDREPAPMTHSPKDMSALVGQLRSSAKAFRENTVYGQDGDPLRLGVQAAECDEAADALESMAAEIAALQAKVGEASDNWEAEAALNTSRACGYHIPPDAGRSEYGTGAHHAFWMLAEIAYSRVTGRKAHRWLGYAQGLLVAAGVLDLERAKLANKAASDAAAHWLAEKLGESG